MKYWLFKSEPTSFSIDALKASPKQITPWDGVRNYQARNFMRDEMKIGDLGFFYHSNCKTIGIVGIVKVVKEAYPDFTAFDPEDHHYDPKSDPDNPRWMMVDVQFQQKFSDIITLDQLKQNPLLKDMRLLRKGNRLSITPVTQKQWNAIMAQNATT